jgi:hypothetical protein
VSPRATRISAIGPGGAVRSGATGPPRPLGPIRPTTCIPACGRPAVVGSTVVPGAVGPAAAHPSGTATVVAVPVRPAPIVPVPVVAASVGTASVVAVSVGTAAVTSIVPVARAATGGGASRRDSAATGPVVVPPGRCVVASARAVAIVSSRAVIAGTIRDTHEYRIRTRDVPPQAGALRTQKSPATNVARLSRSCMLNVGGDLLSHTLPGAVPSALEGLATGFGMGPGVPPPPQPPTTQTTYSHFD